MLSDRSFQIALLISVVTHGVILVQNPNFNIFPVNKNERVTELVYVREAKQANVLPKSPPLKREPLVKLPSKVTIQRVTLPPPPYADSNAFVKSPEEALKASKSVVPLRQSVFSKPAFTKPDIISVKKRITLPAVDSDKINNPTYINYYQLIREKIRRAAYQNYTHAEEGEVFFTFIVSDDGGIKEVKLIEEKSAPNAYLREIGLKSIRDASPFPNFPKELDYPQLTFNVIISFEIE